MDTGENADIRATHVDAVAKLQAKKANLESTIQDRTQELKLLCIKEAELTGVLPPEIPLDPGETPPTFRRRVGTAFQYPENLLNSSRIYKSKEEESLDGLELAYKIQTGIVEVALGLANDGTASKAVRRRRRQDYQLAQDRLLELETRLSALRQARGKPLKQRKKPRPPLDPEGDGINLSPLQTEVGPPSPNHNHVGVLRQPPAHNTYLRHTQDGKLLYPHYQRPGYYQHQLINSHYPTLATCGGSELDRIGRWERSDHLTMPHCFIVSEQDRLWYTTPRPPHVYHETVSENWQHDKDRFGSLDRRKAVTGPHSSSSPSLEAWGADEVDAVYHVITPPPPRVQPPQTLLPSQTYPDIHSLTRTQSLGSVGSSLQPTDRKQKEKEWYETSLDSAPLPQRAKPESKVEVASDVSSSLSRSSSSVSGEQRPQMRAWTNELPSSDTFDTVVPFESPKNHMVVQAGKWQPYREVTKPFEMADFYKYSTKFRKAAGNRIAPPPPQKAYSQTQLGEPSTSTNNRAHTVSSNASVEGNVEESLGEAFSTEMLAWYQDRSVPRSATLV